MLNDITIGQYYPAKSVIHKLDARVKLVATFIFMISLFIINKFWTYLIVVASLIAIIKLSKIPAKYILKGLKPLKWIIIFTFFINIFFIPGDVVWSFGFIKITQQGISQYVFMALRLIFLVVGTSLLTLTTSPIELTDGIEKLLNPFRKVGLPVHELAMMMTIALRFIPTLLDETDKIMKAQMSRGADFESNNIINRAKNLVPLLIPLFICNLITSKIQTNYNITSFIINGLINIVVINIWHLITDHISCIFSKAYHAFIVYIPFVLI